MHENIAELNLDGNRITSLTFADTISSCPRLSILSLARNPIARAPKYRLVVAALVPSLRLLDETIVEASTDQTVKLTNGMLLEVANAMQVKYFILYSQIKDIV